ncbi:mechanosensitive ion channel family protein [Mucilaginibacter sp. L196]|uniref:mechanosensitive ion channel family protein n=1 Tax=Mucilaginibacter sp. L196 TaxID=1641870 RepID=UPI00131D7E06|nr:mechanosensitive ion channel domain-containing protein [Mucilaginibacter sp. L196]
MKLTKFYDKAYDWALDIGPLIIIGLIILFIGLWLIKVVAGRLRAQMSKRKVHSSLQPFFLSLTITSLYILLIILVMSVIGFQLTIFSTIIGAFGVAAGLALSGTLQNFAGGVLILMLKPFQIDDNIVAQGQDGVVTTIQIFYTVLITADNKTVIIPNGKLFNEVIVNVTREGKRRLDFEIKLGYAANVEQVKTIILDAIKVTPNILPDPRNKVGISALEVDGVKFVVNVWVNPSDFGTTRLALHEKIINDLVSGGIKLPGM